MTNRWGDRGPERPERCKMLTAGCGDMVTFYSDDNPEREWLRCHEDLLVVIGQ